MAIKLYKSQLEPTAKSSNVENRAFASMSEAGSIGRAFKGMVQSGEKLYYKHLDIKSDNEVLEKSKEVMNGSDTFDGLSSITLKASQMSDPDAALKYYNEAWQKIFDSSSSNLSPMAQKKFKHWMTKQNIKDAHSIKVQATTNMINSLRTNKLDQIETLKKSIIFGASLESETARGELEAIFSDKKTLEIFGNKLDGVIKSTRRDIAFYGYKNMSLSEKDKVLAAALKDDRINDEDYLKLKTHFEAKKSSINHKNRNDVNNMESNIKSGLSINTDEFETAVAIALETQDEKTLLKLEQIRIDAPIYAQLSTMSVADIENRVNILTEYKNKKKDGMELRYANNLNISKKYLAALTTSLNKDQLMTGNDRGVVNINEIGFEKLLTTDGDVSEFASDIKERIAQAKTVADHYKRPVVFFTANEKTAIQGAFESARTSDQIINLSTALVQGFGQDSDLAFQELSKDNTFLAHVGGLVMSNNGVPGNNVRLAVQGYMMFKNNPDLVKAYKVKSTDNNYLTKIGEYNEAFLENSNTFNSTVEMANYIFAAELKNSGKSIGNLPFNWDDDWEKAFKMAAGGTFITEGRNHWMGGFDEWNGNKVHIPNWIKEGNFDNIVELLKKHPELVDMASSNDQAPVDVTGKTINIFENQDPYFVSVGDGLYKIAMGENPKEFGAEEEYAMNTDGGFFVIDLNKIKEDIITSLK